MIFNSFLCHDTFGLQLHEHIYRKLGIRMTICKQRLGVLVGKMCERKWYLTFLE